MHKHFRMLSISQHLRNHGHNPKSEPHTGIPGIWKKLVSLYNLKVLDERVSWVLSQLSTLAECLPNRKTLMENTDQRTMSLAKSHSSHLIYQLATLET